MSYSLLSISISFCCRYGSSAGRREIRWMRERRFPHSLLYLRRRARSAPPRSHSPSRASLIQITNEGPQMECDLLVIVLPVLYVVLPHHFHLSLRGILLPLVTKRISSMRSFEKPGAHVEEVDLSQQLLLMMLELPHGPARRKKM